MKIDIKYFQNLLTTFICFINTKVLFKQIFVDTPTIVDYINKLLIN